jgi:hypothetical protein
LLSKKPAFQLAIIIDVGTISPSYVDSMLTVKLMLPSPSVMGIAWYHPTGLSGDRAVES